MAYRLNSSHVCFVAKTAVLQAKEGIRTVTPTLLKSSSRDISCNESPNNTIIEKDERIVMLRKLASSKPLLYGRQNFSNSSEASKKIIGGDVTKIKEGVPHKYLTKLCKEDADRLFFSSQSNKINSLSPEIQNVFDEKFKEESMIKWKSEQSAQRCIDHPYQLPDYTSRNSNYASSPTDHTNRPYETTQTMPSSSHVTPSCKIDNSMAEHSEKITNGIRDGISTDSNVTCPPELKLDDPRPACPKPSYSDILKKRVKLLESDNTYEDGNDESFKKLSTRLFSNKLFGSRPTLSPLIGPQFLQENLVNLRSVCGGQMKPDNTCNKVSIKKVSSRKKKLPKLLPTKCPKLVRPPMKSVPFIPLKKRYSPKDPLRCFEVIEDEPCVRADDDWRLSPKPFSKISDCPKAPSTFYMKPCPSLPRLPKTSLSDPPRKCPKRVEICQVRSDTYLHVQKRRLPTIATGIYVRKPPRLPSRSSIRRLERFDFPDPPRSCPEPPSLCSKRADDTLEVSKKPLPQLKSSCRPPQSFPVPKKPPELKRLPIHEEHIPRICRVIPQICDKPSRADVYDWIYYTRKPWEKPSLKNDRSGAKKTLPKYISSSCCTATDYKLKDGSPLKKPRKLHIPQEPAKICKKPKTLCEPVTVRADDNLQISRKQLPKVEAGRQPCNCPILRQGPPLKRLEKVLIPEPPKVCVVKEDICTERSDASLKITKLNLPKLKPCMTPPKMKEEKKPLIAIKRLPKADLLDPKRICQKDPPKICERADKGLLVAKKKLPELKTAECPVIEVTKPKSAPPLKRLQFRIYDQECKIKPKPTPKCFRSDINDWDFIEECRCFPRKDTCHDARIGSVNGKRSMSTNLSEYYNKGLLTRRTQLSHIDIRKRLSTENFLQEYLSSTRANDSIRTYEEKKISSKENDTRKLTFPVSNSEPKNRKIIFSGIQGVNSSFLVTSPSMFRASFRSKSLSSLDSSTSKIKCPLKTEFITRFPQSSSSKIRSGRSSFPPCPPLPEQDCATSSCSHCPPKPQQDCAPPKSSSCSHCPQFPMKKTDTSSSCSHCPQYPPRSSTDTSCSHCPKYPPQSSSSCSHCPTYPPRCSPPTSSSCPPSPTRSQRQPSCSSHCPNFPPKNQGNLCSGISSCRPATTQIPLCSPGCPPLFSPPSGPCLSPQGSCEQTKVLVRRKPSPKFTSTCGQKLSLWQRIKNYFKARPNCPPACEYKKRKIMKKLQKMADKAGMAIYDPSGDPHCICQEVERRCLERRMQRRCYGTVGHIVPLSSVVVSPLIDEGLIVLSRSLLLSRCSSCYFRRSFSNWKNTFEFYGIHSEDETQSKNFSSEFDEPHKASCDKALYLFNSYGGFDFDGLKENTYKSLWMTSFLASSLGEDDLKENISYLLECCSDNLHLKREILVQLLRRISKDLESKSSKNKVDTSEVTRDLIEKILSSKS